MSKPIRSIRPLRQSGSQAKATGCATGAGGVTVNHKASTSPAGTAHAASGDLPAEGHDQ
jgi:hypothetical protein